MNPFYTFKHINNLLNQASIDSRLYTLLEKPKYADRQIGFPYFCALCLLYTNGAVFTWFTDVKKHPTIIELNRINFLLPGVCKAFKECFPEWIQGYKLSSLGTNYLGSLNILPRLQKLDSNYNKNSNAQPTFQTPSIDEYDKLEGVLDREEQFNYRKHPSLYHCYNHLVDSSALSEARFIQFLIQNHVKITLPVIQFLKYNLFSKNLKLMGSGGDSNVIFPDFFMLF